MKKKRNYQIVVDYKGLKVPFVIKDGKLLFAGNRDILTQWGLDYIVNLHGDELREFGAVVEMLKSPELSMQFWLMKMFGFKVKEGTIKGDFYP